MLKNPVHRQPWRFYPNKSKTFTEIRNAKGAERTLAERLLLTELQQRHQDLAEGRDPGKPRRRRRGPRTLQPMPHMRASQHAHRQHPSPSMLYQQQQRMQMQPPYQPYGSTYAQEMQLSPGGGGRGSPFAGGGDGGGGGGSGGGGGGSPQYLQATSSSPAMLGGPGGGSPMLSPMMGGNGQTFADPNEYYRWKSENDTVVSAVTKQLKRYKLECRRLRKQKRATLYVLRLLEQKILELSGSNATVDRVDPQAPGYEMHPGVYKLLKEGKGAPRKGCRGIQTGSDAVDVVEDYALERSAHELGLKLVREDAETRLDREERDEAAANQEARQQQEAVHAQLDQEKAARDAARDAQAAADEEAVRQSKAEAEAALAADRAAADAASQDDRAKAAAAAAAAAANEATSLADKAREEHLRARRQLFRDIFDRLDVDNSGTLDKGELRKAVFFGDRELGSYIQPKRFAQAFTQMDHDNTGHIEYEAFEAFCLDCEDAGPGGVDGDAGGSGGGGGGGPGGARGNPSIGALHAQRKEWTDEKLAAMFHRLDTNGNGTLERVELLRAAHRDPELACFVTPARVNTSFAEMSAGGQRDVDVEAFKRFCRRASSAQLVVVEAGEEERANLRKLFDRLDTDGSGTLERMELYKACHVDKELSTFVAPKQFRQAFARMDILGDGHVSFESFCSFAMDVRNANTKNT